MTQEVEGIAQDDSGSLDDNYIICVYSLETRRDRTRDWSMWSMHQHSLTHTGEWRWREVL